MRLTPFTFLLAALALVGLLNITGHLLPQAQAQSPFQQGGRLSPNWNSPTQGGMEEMSWRKLESGTFHVLGIDVDRSVLVVPPGKVVLLRHLWLVDPVFTSAFHKFAVQRADSSREELIKLGSSESGGIAHGGREWRSAGFRLGPGDSLLVRNVGSTGSPWIGWSGFLFNE